LEGIPPVLRAPADRAMDTQGKFAGRSLPSRSERQRCTNGRCELAAAARAAL
jgi:hypothetical protein